MADQTDLTCSCGKVAFRLSGAPIVSTECCCISCRKAGAILAALPGAPDMLNAHGGTRMVLFRKDRVACIAGAEHLREHRLDEKSPTRRVVAACCNTPVFLDFTHGHWLSLYGHLWPASALPRCNCAP